MEKKRNLAKLEEQMKTKTKNYENIINYNGKFYNNIRDLKKSHNSNYTSFPIISLNVSHMIIEFEENRLCRFRIDLIYIIG